MLLLLLSLLATPSLRECKYLVLYPMELKLEWVAESELIARKKRKSINKQIVELWQDPTIKEVYFYDNDFIYIRRKGKTFAEQYALNRLPMERVAIDRSL